MSPLTSRMSRYLFLLSLGLMLSLHGMAQQTEELLLLAEDPMSVAETPHSSSWSSNAETITLFGEFTQASNALSQSFTNKLIFGGFIDEQLKTNAQDRLAGDNRVGYAFATGLKFYGKAKNNDRLSFRGRIGYSFTQDVGFSDGVFNLIFFGNAGLLGQDVSLNNTNVLYLVKQHYDFGVGYNFRIGSGTLQTDVYAGFVQGLSQASSELNGTLLTSSDATAIDLSATGNLYLSDDRAPKLTALNGAGWQSGISFQYKNTLESGILKISASLEDFGSVSWGNPGALYSGDSTWNWSGFEADDLSDLSGLTLTGETDSLLDLLGLEASEGKYTETLPYRWAISASMLLNSGLQVSLGATQQMRTSQVPLIYAIAGKEIADTGLGVFGRVSYGGWGGIQAGLDLKWDPCSRFTAHLGATNVLTWVIPEAMTGGSLYVALSTNF